MEQRRKFVIEAIKRLKPLSETCRDFGISRKQGYKWLKRFQKGGEAGLVDRPRSPSTCPHKTTELWRSRIIQAKKNFSWGSKKLRVKLFRKYGAEGLPATSTVASILGKEGLLKACRRRRQKHPRQPLVEHRLAVSSNVVWAIDFKGWFRTGDGQRCDPLTVSDLYSRFVLCCRLVKSQSFSAVQPVFIELFKLYGLPQNIRSDNGSPFASTGVGGLSELSIWFLTLGIRPEFIEPGHPEQNGIHERMHRTLKAEVTKPAACTWPAQQRRMERWRQRYNCERPHEALAQNLPVDFYLPSSTTYQTRTIAYPHNFHTRRVEVGGRINWNGSRWFIGKAFKNQLLGLKALEPHRLEVYFSDRLLGELNTESAYRGLAPCKQISI